MSVSNNGRSKHGVVQEEVRTIKEKMRKKFGRNYESIIDREILAAANAKIANRSSQSPNKMDLRLSEGQIEDSISRKIQTLPKKLNYQFQTLAASPKLASAVLNNGSQTSLDHINRTPNKFNQLTVPFRRSSQGGV